MPISIDIGLSPFDADARWILEAAVAAEESGYEGVWTMDHLSGSVVGKSSSMEAFTLLGAIAACTTSVVVGSLVINQRNRHPALLAASAATLQDLSDGRAILGIGLGAGGRGPYRTEQAAMGRAPEDGATRRARLREVIAVQRGIWAGQPFSYLGRFYKVTNIVGWPIPDPTPPIIIGANGPLAGALAGEIADGINIAAGNERIDEILSVARAAAGERPFMATAYGSLSDEMLDASSVIRTHLAAIEIDRLVLFTTQDAGIEQISRLERESSD